MLTPKEFKRLKLQHKYNLLKKEGTHLASRIYSTYNIHLFQLENFYVEVWYKIALNQIYWIEVLQNESALDQYLQKIDVKKELGLN